MMTDYIIDGKLTQSSGYNFTWKELANVLGSNLDFFLKLMLIMWFEIFGHKYCFCPQTYFFLQIKKCRGAHIKLVKVILE